MNPTKLSALAACALFAAAGTNTNLNAAEVTLTDGAGIEWFGYRSNTKKTVFEYSAGTTTMTNLDKDSYVWGYLPQSVALSLGDSLTLTGTAVFKTVAATSAFYFGLYNSGANTKPETGTSFTSIVAGTYDMTGFFGGTSQKTTTVTITDPETDEPTTVKEVSLSTSIFSRFAGKTPTVNEDGSLSGNAGFMTTNQGGSYIAGGAVEGSTLSHPTANTAYDFSLKILKTGAGYDITIGDSAMMSFVSEQSLAEGTFDVIGMKSPGNGITLTNLSITTTGTIIPEPSAFGLMGGGAVSRVRAVFPPPQTKSLMNECVPVTIFFSFFRKFSMCSV